MTHGVSGSPSLCKLIATYTCETSLFCTSRQFALIQRTAQEKEWKSLHSYEATGAEIEDYVKVVARANHIAIKTKNPPIPDPFIPDFFKQLYQQQKALACITQAGRESFHQVGRIWKSSYRPGRFIAAEAVVRKVGVEMDVQLQQTWVKINRKIGNIAPNLPTANAIRGWMNANQELFKRIDSLDLSLSFFTVLSPELHYFKDLRKVDLHFSNYLRDFPALKKLPFLEEIDLGRSGLEYVPEELLELPQLKKLDLSGNPLKVLPEQLYDQFSSWQDWLCGRDIPKPSYIEWHMSHFRFSKDKLEEIPFSMWLRKRINDFDLVDYILTKLDLKTKNCSLGFCIAHTLLLPFMIILGIIDCVLRRFFSFFVIPVITKVRELFGYGRMIRINVGEL